MYRKILVYLQSKKEPCTQSEISNAIPKMHRIILLGYLRCLVDIGMIKSKKSGKALIYYI
ncbi:MAG: hypothetical protein WC494_01135 [Candidatus Pacearchaeota archaeon]